MGRGVPPGNKIPVLAKGCKPRKKAKGSWAPWQPEDGVNLETGPVQAAHKDLEPVAMPCLTSSVLKLAQATWVSSSISVATVRLTTTITDSLGHGNPLCQSQSHSQTLQDRVNLQVLSGHATQGHPSARFHGNTETEYPFICGYYDNPGRGRYIEDKGLIWKNHSQTHSLMPSLWPALG